jgi:hypothetical protein
LKGGRSFTFFLCVRSMRDVGATLKSGEGEWKKVVYLCKVVMRHVSATFLEFGRMTGRHQERHVKEQE